MVPNYTQTYRILRVHESVSKMEIVFPKPVYNMDITQHIQTFDIDAVMDAIENLCNKQPDTSQHPGIAETIHYTLNNRWRKDTKQ